MTQINIITLERQIRVFCIDAEKLVLKIRNKEIDEKEKTSSVLTLHKKAEDLNKQLHETLCRRKYVNSFATSYSDIKNLYLEVLKTNEIRRDL